MFEEDSYYESESESFSEADDVLAETDAMENDWYEREPQSIDMSSPQDDVENEEELLSFFLYFALAFVFTVIIELIVNSLFLKKHYEFSPVMRATTIANVVSFMVGSMALYSYSFTFFD